MADVERVHNETNDDVHEEPVVKAEQPAVANSDIDSGEISNVIDQLSSGIEKLDESEMEALIEALDPKSVKLLSITASQTISEQFSGPIPHPRH